MVGPKNDINLAILRKHYNLINKYQEKYKPDYSNIQKIQKLVQEF